MRTSGSGLGGGAWHSNGMDTRDEGGGAVDDLLRPPESWPGAGGLKSVAPEVPSWPTGPVRIPGGIAYAQVLDKPVANPVTATPGGGWPGMSGASSRSETPPAENAEQAPPTRAGRKATKAEAEPQQLDPVAARRRRTMSAAMLLLVACLAVAAWVVLDQGHRMTQLAVLVVVLVVGGVFVALTNRRK